MQSELRVRERILDEAKRVICQDRQDQYGNAEDSFEKIAAYWNVFLTGTLKEGRVLTNDDVAMMMILLKIARSDSNPFHTDNYIDICGYAALAAELVDNGNYGFQADNRLVSAL